MPDWSQLRESLHQQGLVVAASEPVAVSGGDISAAWRLDSAQGPLFLKTSRADDAANFAAEAEGLNALRTADAIRVPEVWAVGVSGNSSYLALEWLDLKASTDHSERQLGERLALQHRVTQEACGWHIDNTIGLTTQVNSLTSEWCEFFVRHRIGFQLQLARARGVAGELAEMRDDILGAARALLVGYQPKPSLLHGDLWAGNHAALGSGEPVVFDPAVYFGDRETDIAMTQLFGGFSESFYSGYNAAWPLDAGHEQRADLYHLYHVLNHVNIFGSGYLGRALALARSIAA